MVLVAEMEAEILDRLMLMMLVAEMLDWVKYLMLMVLVAEMEAEILDQLMLMILVAEMEAKMLDLVKQLMLMVLVAEVEAEMLDWVKQLMLMVLVADMEDEMNVVLEGSSSVALQASSPHSISVTSS